MERRPGIIRSRNASQSSSLSPLCPENVFALGNLVHGKKELQENDIGSFFTHGIQAGHVPESHPRSPDTVCLALMTTGSTPSERYHAAEHHGPKYFYETHSMGIVVSGERLQRAYAGRVFAVGPQLQDTPLQAIRSIGGFIPRKVHGIPVRRIEGLDLYNTEVRVYPGRGQAVTADSFLGLTIVEGQWKAVLQMFKGQRTGRDIGVYSPDCQHLGMLTAEGDVVDLLPSSIGYSIPQRGEIAVFPLSATL